jgi:hypothetical protein
MVPGRLQRKFTEKTMGRQCGDWLGRQRVGKKDQVVSVPGPPDPPTMPLPGNEQVSRAAIAGVFSWKYLLRTGGKSADEDIGEKCISPSVKLCSRPM